MAEQIAAWTRARFGLPAHAVVLRVTWQDDKGQRGAIERVLR